MRARDNDADRRHQSDQRERARSFALEVRAMSDTIRCIGVLTGGGDCPGLNAVIRAVVKTASNEYGWEVLGIEDGFEGFIKLDKVRLLDITDVRGLLPRGGTMLGSTNRANPFHYEVSNNGKVKVFDVSETVLHRARTMASMCCWSLGATARCALGVALKLTPAIWS